MFCSHCGAKLPDDAKFCHACGARVDAAPPAERGVNTAGGAFVGGSVQAGQDFVGRDKVNWTIQRVEGNLVLDISRATPEVIEQLAVLKAMSTEVKPEEGRRAAPDPRLDALEREVHDLLAIVRQAESGGARIAHVQVGDQKLATVELLLKRAILLKSDAEQMFFTYLQQNAQKVQAAQWQSIYTRTQIDPRRAFSDFDWPAYDAKLREAKALLDQANAQEPTNAEVLLHMAQVQGALAPNDKATFRALVYRVTQLLSSPRTREEHLWLAQATFMMAFAEPQVNLNFLRSARDRFAQLGETLWVQYCDSIAQVAMSMQGFQPVGQWQFRNPDGSLVTVIFQPDGTYSGTVQNMLGWSQLAGRWHYDAASQTLYAQGWVNGVIPFQSTIHVQGQQQPGVFFGAAADGSFVTFWRTG